MQLIPIAASSLASFASRQPVLLPLQATMQPVPIAAWQPSILCFTCKTARLPNSAIQSQPSFALQPGSLASSSPACLACPATKSSQPIPHASPASLANPCQTARQPGSQSSPCCLAARQPKAWQPGYTARHARLPNSAIQSQPSFALQPGILASSSPACITCPAASLTSPSPMPYSQAEEPVQPSLPDMPIWPVMLECLAGLNRVGKARLALPALLDSQADEPVMLSFCLARYARLPTMLKSQLCHACIRKSRHGW